MIGVIHVHWAAVVPVAVVALLFLAWYWKRLGRPEVIASRRRIRRVSLIIMAVVVVLVVRGLSFVDPAVEGRAYAIIWTLAVVGVALVVMTAVVDALNSFRAHNEERQAELAETAATVFKALERESARRRTSPGDPDPPEAEDQRG